LVAEIALVTANIGGMDPVFSLPPHPGIDAFYYADLMQEAALGWTRIFVADGGPRRLLSKRMKCQIHRLEEVRSYRWMAWTDASFEFRSLEFLPDWARAAEAQGADAVFVPHPHRKTVAEEYAYILRLLDEGNEYLTVRYPPEPLRRERAHFAERHDLSALPMWCGGLWMVANGPRVHGFLDAWWQTVNEYSALDQAAISPLLVEHDIKAISADVDIYESPNWKRHAHR